MQEEQMPSKIKPDSNFHTHDYEAYRITLVV